MTNLLTIPMEDDFETTLSGSWSGGTGAVSVNDTPTGTIPSGQYSYIVVSPGESNMQVAKIDGWDGGAKTINVSSIAVKKGTGVDYSAQSHAANSVVRFSNNFQFRYDLQQAINSKLEGSALGNFTITGSGLDATGSMVFSDDETAPVTLKTLAEGNGADQYFAISENDTTVGHFEDKVTFGDGVKGTKKNPGANEQMDIEIDTTDTAVFVNHSSGATDAGKIPLLGSDGKLLAFTLNSFILGENIASEGGVALMPDGKVYKITNNKRTLSNGAITGHTTVKSAMLLNGKIATVGLTGSTLTLYIGTIDYATNTITYGSGVQVCTNAASLGGIASAGTDKCMVFYSVTSTKSCNVRAVTISGTVPTIGIDVQIAAGYYSASVTHAIYITEGQCVIGYYISNNGAQGVGTYVIYMSGSTAALGGAAGGVGNSRLDVQRVSTTQYVAYGWTQLGPDDTYLQCFSISGNTPTMGSNINLRHAGSLSSAKGSFATDGTYIYLANGPNSLVYDTLNVYTISGNTLTQVWAQGSLTAGPLCLSGGMLGYVSSQSIVWNSIGSASITARNTINYGIDLTNLYENNFSLTGYFVFTVSGNPSYVYKIGNEERNMLGYLVTTGNLGDIKSVFSDGDTITGLTGIIPGETYYIVVSTGALGFAGTHRLGKGLTTTSIKVNTNIS